MMRRVSLLLYTDSKIYKLTIRMHFDKFNAVKKEKLYFFTIHLIFSIAPPCTLSNEKPNGFSVTVVDFFQSINCINVSIHGSQWIGGNPELSRARVD